MRTLRVLLCSLVLASLAFAQTPTSPSTSQDPNQAPQNPLQEPQKTSEADAKKGPQKSDFNVGEAATAGQDQFLGEVRLMIRHTELGGGYQQRSFLTKGENLLGEANFFSDQKFLTGHRFQMLSMFRGTNDRSIDPEQNSLQKAYVRIYSNRDEYVFGDVLVNYSRLAFNQNVKGASLSWKLGDQFKLSTIGGIYTDRWGSLYHDYTDNPNRPYRARVLGGRVEFAPTKKIVLGWNFSSFTDVVSSLPASATGLVPATNMVGSLDWKASAGGFRFNGEVANAATKGTVKDGVPDFDKRLTKEYLLDFGGFGELSYRYKRLSVRSSVVRYQPNFASLNARQISDLQDLVARVSYEATSWLTIDGTGRRSNDNLASQKNYQTNSLAPEGRLIFHDLPIYKRLVIEAGYRQRMTYASNQNKAACTALQVTNPNACLADRTVRMPFAEITLPIKTTFIGIGYERRRAIDSIDTTQSTNTNRVYASFRGIYDLGGWHINPVFRYELERLGQRQGLKFTSPVDLLTYDNNRLGSAQLYIETPKYFIVELAFRDASSTLTTLNEFGTSYTAVPAGYSRPQYKAALTYKFRNDENTLLIFSFERNNNFYFAPSPNYDERVFGVSLVYKFGRRGK